MPPTIHLPQVIPIDLGPTVERTKGLPWFWVRDDRGVAGVTVTFTSIAFLVTTLAYLLAIVDKVHVFGQDIAFRSFDVAACSSYFVPILTLYFGRKFTKARYGHDKPEEPVQGPFTSNVVSVPAAK